MRPAPSTSRGETSSARAPQAISLTHPNAIIVEHCFYSQAYCSVGLWCMCPMSGGTQSGPTGWEMNGVYKMGQRNKRTHKVIPQNPNMQICDVFRRRPQCKHTAVTRFVLNTCNACWSSKHEAHRVGDDSIAWLFSRWQALAGEALEHPHTEEEAARGI